MSTAQTASAAAAPAPTPTPTPTAALPRAGVTLLATCLALFLGQVDTTAVNVALPAVRHDLSGGLAGLQWVVDAYNVTFAALLLTGGTLGDRFGRRHLFRIGVAVFVLGSAACALAPGLPMLLAGRVTQGAGAGMMLPQSLAILATAFPGRRERNRAMAAWSLVAGSGLAVGPTLGGLAVQTLGWQSIFWVNVPIGVAALALTLRHVPESRNPDARSLDPLGQVLAVVSLALITFVVVQGRELGWTSPATLLCVAGCVAGPVAFVAAERRRRAPMIPLPLLRRGQLPVSMIVAACMTFGMYGMLMLTSLMFQQERGASALGAGMGMLPLAVAATVLSPLTGRLVTKHGPRLPMTAGMAAMGLGILIYAVAGADANLLLLETAFTVIGVGLALNTGPVVGVAVSAVAPELAGLASGLANLARMFGATLGVAVQGTVMDLAANGATSGPHFVHGLRVALTVACTVEFAGAVVAYRYVANPRPAA
ncbi:MFS transporter [Catenulispora pinisilvae]|uniref:MFS transporter n=1 Tax=Catenulispora pinisilvae TaxID=2705253 RepID=UPI001891F99B|nr:MFS transporter [Catenulispora pinisilvae]